MHYILYRSASPFAQDSDVVLDILRGAIAFNDQNGLTGFLMARAGGFVQFIEGSEEALRRCFERIEASPLHGEVDVVAAGSAPQRRFSNWSMGLLSDSRRVAERVRRWSGGASLDAAPPAILATAMVAQARERGGAALH